MDTLAPSCGWVQGASPGVRFTDDSIRAQLRPATGLLRYRSGVATQARSSSERCAGSTPDSQCRPLPAAREQLSENEGPALGRRAWCVTRGEGNVPSTPVDGLFRTQRPNELREQLLLVRDLALHHPATAAACIGSLKIVSQHSASRGTHGELGRRAPDACSQALAGGVSGRDLKPGAPPASPQRAAIRAPPDCT